MGKAIGLAIAIALLVAGIAPAAAGPTGKLLAGSEETVLRLHDLPPGYRIGDDSGCDALVPSSDRGSRERAVKRFFRWILRYWPEGCTYEYEQVFEVPRLGPAPPLITAQTINTPSDAAASAGLELLTPLLEAGVRQRGTVSIAPGGPQALLLRTSDELVEGKKGQPGSLLFWRSGTLLAVVEAAGDPPRRNDRTALRLARVQQQRLEAPTPYSEAEQDDAEVALDDPGLGFPVYWVGRSFEPGEELPPTDLEAAFTRDGPPGIKTELWYEAFTLGTWTTASWRKFAASRLGEVNLHARCTTEERLALGRGSAVVYATFAGRLRGCPARRPDRFYAIARIGGMVIGVNLSNCLRCRPGLDGPYGSRRGVVAILRSLAVRPRPHY